MRFILILLCWLYYVPLAAQVSRQAGFVENKGQIVDEHGKPNAAVKYLLNTSGLNVQLRNNGFSYDFYETKDRQKTGSHQIPGKSAGDLRTINQPEYVFHRVDIEFANSNPNVQLVAEQKSGDYDHYYTVAHAPDGILYVHQFQKIIYRDLYDNIDVVFFIPEDKSKPVEYNFIVHPDGDVADIRMRFDGAATKLTENRIQMKVRFGLVEETLPMSWLDENGIHKEVAVSYKQVAKNTYGFSTNSATHGKKLIIDPVPIRLWGTYYAGNNGDYSEDVSTDANHNVYISGFTYSTANIATTGTFPSTPYSNGFIAKFNAAGVRQWGIYYTITPFGIKADANENLYFTGSAWSEANIATPGAHQPEQHDYYDAVLVKLDPTGVRQWGTYYGGSLSDHGKAICFDNQHNVYMAGSAGSHSGIGTPGTHQPEHAPGYSDDDGFIVKFTPLGVRVWGTYVGGLFTEEMISADMSADGFVYITANTRSSDGIATPGAYQTAMAGYQSAMIAKFDQDGQRIWGTYFNGASSCFIISAALQGNAIYFTGTTNHQSLGTPGAFNEGFLHLFMHYGYGTYVAKFDLATQTKTWLTYFAEHVQDIGVNASGKAFITGCTSIPTGMATPGSYSTQIQYSDAFVVKLDGAGQREWGTYYGGNFFEGSNGAWNTNNRVTLDGMNHIYLMGNTDSNAGISTPGAHVGSPGTELEFAL